MSCWAYCYKFGNLGKSRVQDTRAFMLAETVANLITEGKEINSIRMANIKCFYFLFR